MARCSGKKKSTRAIQVSVLERVDGVGNRRIDMRIYAIRCSLVAVAAPYLLVAAAHAGGPVGTAFTYQGQLKLSGVPVSDSCDVEFTLWDDPVAILVANQVGPTLIFDGEPGNSPPIQVVNGLFTVALESGGSFGCNHGLGSDKWPSPVNEGLPVIHRWRRSVPAFKLKRCKVDAAV